MNFSAHWHLVHANLQEKRKVAWPLTHQWYSVHLLLYLNRWRQARRAGTIAGLPFPRSVALRSVATPFSQSFAWAMSLFTYSSGWNQSDGRTIAVLDLRPRFAPGNKIPLIYRMFRACLGSFEGAAAR
jgi:hypothetical protein